MSEDRSIHIETLAVHAGAQPEPATGAVSPSIHLSTIFERDADGGYSRGYSYQRKANPTRGSLETALALMEGGVAAAAFSSGSAATTTIMQTLAPGDHVILPGDAYYGTRVILNDCLTPWGLEATYVEIGDLDAVRAAVRPKTRMVWVETPSNPMLKIADIAALVKIAHGTGAICVCDLVEPIGKSQPTISHHLRVLTASGLTRMYVGDGNTGSPTAHVYRSGDVATGVPVFTDLTAAESPAGQTDNYCSGQCWYDNLVVTPAGYPDIVYIGGSYDYGTYALTTNSRGLLRSTDAGVSWTDMSWDSTTAATPPGSCCARN